MLTASIPPLPQPPRGLFRRSALRAQSTFADSNHCRLPVVAVQSRSLRQRRRRFLSCHYHPFVHRQNECRLKCRNLPEFAKNGKFRQIPAKLSERQGRLDSAESRVLAAEIDAPQITGLSYYRFRMTLKMTPTGCNRSHFRSTFESRILRRPAPLTIWHVDCVLERSEEVY